jgi:ABC-2 type transport system ATP-binding protein
LCDRVGIIDRGRIAAIGAPRELTAQSNALQAVTLVTARPVPKGRLATLPNIDGLVCDGNRARFRTTDAIAALAALTRVLDGQQVEIVDLHVTKGSLEEFFLGLTREEQAPDRSENPGGPGA